MSVTCTFPQLLCTQDSTGDTTSGTQLHSTPPHPLALTVFSASLLPCLLNPGGADGPFRAEHSTVTSSQYSAQFIVSALSSAVKRRLF